MQIAISGAVILPLLLSTHLLFAASSNSPAGSPVTPPHLERSYWLHASLGLFTQRGYFGTTFPATTPPTRAQVFQAARWLCGPGAANRLYLIYHHEISEADARQVFTWWRQACPKSVALVPALVLRMYDTAQTPVFATTELPELAHFFRSDINSNLLAIYDVYPERSQGPGLAQLAELFPKGLIRLGLQPAEALPAPFVAAVQDTWSGFCHGKRNQEDWLQPGFGAPTLRQWVTARNRDKFPVTWNLVTVAWDYQITERGAFPGYDDAKKNMPLPAGRNRLGARLIHEAAQSKNLGGFSSDLYILHENSRSDTHDGQAHSFYETLKAGQTYQGYYAVPLQEIAELFRALQDGTWPKTKDPGGKNSEAGLLTRPR